MSPVRWCYGEASEFTRKLKKYYLEKHGQLAQQGQHFWDEGSSDQLFSYFKYNEYLLLF